MPATRKIPAWGDRVGCSAHAYPNSNEEKKILKNPNTSETRLRYRLSRNQSHRRVSNYRDHLIILTFP